MRRLNDTKNGRPRGTGRNLVVRELVQKPFRNAGRHAKTKAHALEKAMRLDNAKFEWYN